MWDATCKDTGSALVDPTSHTAHVTVHFSGGMPKPSQQLAAVCIVLHDDGVRRVGWTTETVALPEHAFPAAGKLTSGRER